MARLDIVWCSRALVRLGCQPIASFEDGSEEAVLAGNLYPHVRDELLAAHTWKFATGETTLARLSGAPVADFKFAYQLPADLLRVVSAGEVDSSGLTYRIRERTLQTDAPAVTLSYIFRAEEEIYPPHFIGALVDGLCGEFALPLTESSQRAQTFIAKAQDSFTRAKVIDSQQQTPLVLRDLTLINARR